MQSAWFVWNPAAAGMLSLLSLLSGQKARQGSGAG